MPPNRRNGQKRLKKQNGMLYFIPNACTVNYSVLEKWYICIYYEINKYFWKESTHYLMRKYCNDFRLLWWYTFLDDAVGFFKHATSICEINQNWIANCQNQQLNSLLFRWLCNCLNYWLYAVSICKVVIRLNDSTSGNYRKRLSTPGWNVSYLYTNKARDLQSCLISSQYRYFYQIKIYLEKLGNLSIINNSNTFNHLS